MQNNFKSIQRQFVGFFNKMAFKNQFPPSDSAKTIRRGWKTKQDVNRFYQLQETSRKNFLQRLLKTKLKEFWYNIAYAHSLLLVLMSMIMLLVF